MKQLALLGLALLVPLVSPSWARQESLTLEEKQQLEKIDKVLIEVIVLSDKGSTDAGPFREVVTKRLQEFGYTVVTDPAQPHDVTFNVKCEQHKIWEGTTKMGSDADLPAFRCLGRQEDGVAERGPDRFCGRAEGSRSRPCRRSV